MEWLIAAVVAAVGLIWSGIFLVLKLLRLRSPIVKLSQQLKGLSAASAKTPEIAKLASALGQDPKIHLARRLEIKRAAKERKRQQERRLRNRDF